MSRIATKLNSIAPFRVMEILGRARELESSGQDIVHMEIGEPDFVSPQPIIDAGRQALRKGQTHYTPAAGLPALRDAIARYYDESFGVSVDPRRILITPGASGALQLVLGVLLDPGERVAVTDPGYPCNRHMVSLYGGEPVAIPVEASDDFAVRPNALRHVMREPLRALMIASPANPTGNLIDNGTLRELLGVMSAQPDAVLICDEIYQGLQYDRPPATALALNADNLVVINSFSKYFGMTGWRVGWVVAPEWMIDPMERLAQNIFLAAPTVAQHAALAAFDVETRELLETRRAQFGERRDFLYGAIQDLGFSMSSRPDGAFYLYADVSCYTDDSAAFCADLLGRAGVALTPGDDFGAHRAASHVRFAYTTGLDRLEEGVSRLRLVTD